MDVALLLTRLLLAGVFAVAGAAKLADREGSRRSAVDFGVPAALATPFAALLPLAELAVAAALIPASTAWWGAVGALTLLLVFCAGIAANLALGRKPECRCFGQLRSEPAAPKLLVRNGGLAAVAGFVVWWGYGDAGPSALGWLAGLSAAQVVGLVFGVAVLGALTVQGLLLLNLLRQNGRLLMRVEALEEGDLGGGARAGEATSPNGGVAVPPSVGLPIGSAAPDFELLGLGGETLTLASLRASGKPVMLVFTDPDCGSCTAMLPEVRRWQKEHAEELTISLVSRGTVAENRAKSAEQGLRGVLIQRDGEVSEAYEVEATPSAVLVLSDGTVGSRVFEGPDAISTLLEHAVEERSRAMLGKLAPPIELPDLNGAPFSMGSFRGRKLVVLFWDPGCQFCEEMLSDLRAWVDNAPEEAPMLLVVSTGTEEDTRKMGLSPPVLLDAQLVAARAFGAPGTPSAVLIDEQGRVASELAVGVQAILALAHAPQDAGTKNEGFAP